jgi:hypothetical protein
MIMNDYVNLQFHPSADHIEDRSLGSINYLHGGHPQFWRIIAPCFGIKYLALLQKLAQDYFPDCSNCKWFPLHKQLVVNDSELSKNGIPFVHVSSKLSF